VHPDHRGSLLLLLLYYYYYYYYYYLNLESLIKDQEHNNHYIIEYKALIPKR
jgi:hypothetical protein